MARKPQRKRGQKPTRLSISTRDKLDEIMERSLRHYGSYDVLIEELADAALLRRGYPLLNRAAARRVKASGVLRDARSPRPADPDHQDKAS